ncbi:hypothetical protein [Sulfurirhabdus autotrophica]|uniref:Uncharacterized protein n=1 Tax=Sulfurirhabdus autotrophica TaxID=1706046 RepID=A0A4R3XQD8_9PROT|nr:hypothetical protein [Sulfurirhabdus autotrophica]TCV79013.1 hypothetical protein EDC63_13816 [Sulfurirhabdus autotrophica]
MSQLFRRLCIAAAALVLLASQQLGLYLPLSVNGQYVAYIIDGGLRLIIYMYVDTVIQVNPHAKSDRNIFLI